MAPSPAAGKQTGPPKTPTKLTRKPQGSTPASQKAGQTASSATKGTPATPKAAGQKPQSSTPSVSQKPKAEEAQQSAQSATEDVQQQAQSQSGETEEDDGPMSKVSQATGEDDQGLQEAAPEPIDDNETEDAAEGAQQQAQDTAEDAEDEAEDPADDATQKAGDTVNESAEDTTDEQEQQDDQQQSGGEGLLKGAQATADDAQEGAEDAAEDAQETGDDEAQKVEGEVTDDNATETAEGVQEGVEDQAEGAEEQAEGQVEGAEEQAEGAEDQAEGAQDQAEDAAEGAQAEGEEATGQLPEAPEGLQESLDLNVLKDLEVKEDGHVYDNEGNPIGKLAEGDAEDLAGYPIGDNGEILDEDGDLVGRVELLPDEVKRQLQEARDQGEELPEGADEYLDQLNEYGEEAGEEGEEAGEEGPQLPGLEILSGLTCQVDGLIYDADGNTIGQVVDGDPQELQNATLNDQGEFIDENGEVVGHAQIHEDAADLVEQGIYEAADTVGDTADDTAEDTGEQVDGVTDQVEEAGEEAAEAGDEQTEGIEDQLPGIEALAGKDVNEEGDAVVDEEGNIIANITDEELKQKIADGEIDPSTLKINEAGQVVDEEGNVLAEPELTEEYAQKLAGGPLLDYRILEGRKVNKKGQILDEDGEIIGELREGELNDVAGKKVNDKGEILDKQGNIIGRVSIVHGEAAENATKTLLEELGELPAEASDLPDLSILDGYKVNKNGQIINEDGDIIGQLVDGELADCKGKKVNDKGDVLDKDGNVIGRVTTVAPEGEEEQPAEEEPAEEEDQGPELPPLSILEGLTVNKSGKLIDDSGAVVGELIDGDAKKLSKMGAQADVEGQFWDSKGHVIGRAQTLPQEEAEEEAPFAGYEGLHVVDEGYVEDDQGNRVGYLVEGDAKKLLGRTVDEDGDVLDKKGSAVGRAERWYEEEVEEEVPEEADLSFLAGKQLNKAGFVIGDEGIPVARLIEGKAKDLAGMEVDGEGQIWNNKGQVIGRVELIPEEEREAKPEGPFAGLEGLRVIEDGKIADENDNVVGEIVEGNPKRLIGLAVDEDGDIVDRYGNVKGHAEPLPEEEEEVIDNSILNGLALNKQGYVVDDKGIPYGRLVEGDASELVGRKCDENGYLYGDTGKVVGRCEVIPENERVSRPEGPFEGYEGLRVVDEGWVEDENGNRVGQLVEGNVKRLVGMAVDVDGDIIDKYGNVKGHAEPYEEPEVEEVDKSALAGCRINKHGNAVDYNGQIIGRVSEGDVNTLVGKKVDGQGQVWDDSGKVIGMCELVYGEDTSPEGPFAGFENLQINKDGTITTAGGDIIGRVIEGDIQKLLGHQVEEDGSILDKNGNELGKAERWEPEEKERRINPMSGMRVNKEGEVRDENGDLVGKLTDGDLGHCVGQEIDDSGNVVDVDGNKIGECTLLENIAEDYEGPTEEELAEAAKREEERQIAEKMANICQQSLERVQPVCKQIKEYMDKADATPKEELDEEQLVNDVKPLIEEGGRILQECNGSLRGLDPDGHIAAQAKGRSGTGEATPEEHRLAETLKELTTTVVTTIDDAKKKLNNMPHAKKKLNPLWGLMTQPLFQILAAVGLLLAGVLGLVGQLLNGLGLGGLVNGLMGGLGINKLMESFGLGGGDKKKSGGGGDGKSKLSSLPIVGGLLGGK